MYITFTEGWYNIKGQPTNVAGMTFKLVERTSRSQRLAKATSQWKVADSLGSPIEASESSAARVPTMSLAVPNPFHKESAC